MYIHIWNKPVALLIKQSKRIDYLKIIFMQHAVNRAETNNLCPYNSQHLDLCN